MTDTAENRCQVKIDPDVPLKHKIITFTQNGLMHTVTNNAMLTDCFSWTSDLDLTEQFGLSVIMSTLTLAIKHGYQVDDITHDLIAVPSVCNKMILLYLNKAPNFIHVQFPDTPLLTMYNISKNMMTRIGTPTHKNMEMIKNMQTNGVKIVRPFQQETTTSSSESLPVLFLCNDLHLRTLEEIFFNFDKTQQMTKRVLANDCHVLINDKNFLSVNKDPTGHNFNKFLLCTWSYCKGSSSSINIPMSFCSRNITLCHDVEEGSTITSVIYSSDNMNLLIINAYNVDSRNSWEIKYEISSLRVISCKKVPLQYMWIEKFPEPGIQNINIITQQFEYIPKRRAWFLRRMDKCRNALTNFVHESLAMKYDEDDKKRKKTFANYSISMHNTLTTKKKSAFRNCKS